LNKWLAVKFDNVQQWVTYAKSFG